MIYGIGCDVVEIPRFVAKLSANQRLLERLFSPPERELETRSLAARFAAKEALIKALGGSAVIAAGVQYDLKWHDLEIKKTLSQRPEFTKTPGLCAVLEALNLSVPKLSLSHDGQTALAFVILESAGAV